MARIMLATRNDEIRAYMARRFKACGHAVTRVSDYDAALTILEETEYDLLLTTVDAENAEELTFAKAAQQIDPDMRVMFITGFSAVAIRRPDEPPCSEDGLFGQPVHLGRLPEEVTRLVAA